jgi:hypothetical protein
MSLPDENVHLRFHLGIPNTCWETPDEVSFTLNTKTT